MSFEEALTALKQGKKVTRKDLFVKGFKGKRTWIEKAPFGKIGKSKPILNIFIADYMLLPIITSWTPRKEDKFAMDWKIINYDIKNNTTRI